MPLFTLGINHATAPVDIRERLSFTPEQAAEALDSLKALPGVDEALILSTCNRTEILSNLETPLTLRCAVTICSASL